MDTDSFWLSLVLPVILTVLAGMITVCSTAIEMVSEGKLRCLQEEGNKRAKRILKVKEKEFDFLLRTIVSRVVLLGAACCLMVFSFTDEILWTVLKIKALFTGERADMMESSAFLVSLSIVLTFLIAITILTIFGYGLPRRLTANDPQKNLFGKICNHKNLKPLINFLSFVPYIVVRIILRIVKVDPDRPVEVVTEDVIRMMVDAGNESGSIETAEREMINNIFDFDDLEISDIMTHRTDLSAISSTGTLKDAIEVAKEEGFSRIPVYKEDIDNIIGIIYIKDLLALFGEKNFEDKKLLDYMREAVYVPESSSCYSLFKRFKLEKTHFAVVVDEYGGTAGIATMEDLVEAIVGDIQDEYDVEDEEIVKLDENTYLLYGGLSLDDVEPLFDIEFDENEASDTIGGLISNTLGRIPSENEHPSVVIENVEFRVELVEDRRIMKVHAKKILVEQKENPDDED